MNTAVDMANFIEAKSDQLNADDLLQGPRTITVTSVSANPDSAEQPVSIHFEGDNRKPFKPCKTMRRLLVAVWGADASKYVGRSMTLYRDASVQFGGMQVGGIRVSHVSNIDGKQTVPLLVTRGRKKPFVVEPLADAPKNDGLADAIDKVIANIAKAPSAEKLDAYLAGRPAQAMSDARAKRPDLAERLDAALTRKRAEWGDDEDPFAEQEDGASEGENTDAPSSDDLLAELAGAIEQATTAEELDAAAARINDNEGDLAEDDLADLDAAIAAKRRKIK